MDDRFIGYRGSQENEWSWQPDQPPNAAGETHRGRRTLALALFSAFALAASVAGVILFLTQVLDSGGGNDCVVLTVTATAKPSPIASPTGTPTSTPAGTPTPSQTAIPTNTPLPSTPYPALALFAWSDRSNKWQTGDLSNDTSGYANGNAIPFLVELNGVNPGQTYDAVIRYVDCDDQPSTGFDYMTAASDAGTEPLLAAPGPGRARPDAQVPFPDDPAVPGDAGPEMFLALWGGTFGRAPAFTPSLSGCDGARLLTVSVLARSTTLQIDWGGHLASPSDWPGKGAASAREPYGVSVAVTGVGEMSIGVKPEAVSP